MYIASHTYLKIKNIQMSPVPLQATAFKKGSFASSGQRKGEK
jgi:hypothetical protein